MKNYFLFLCLVFLAACNAPRMVTAPRSEPVDFIVLQLNDVYEIAPLEGGKAGGLARVATVRQELLNENSNVITVLAGDFLSPSFLGTMKIDNENGEREKIAGLQMVETLNAMGLDYVTFGNHEFDISDPALLEKRIAQSDFAWTVCNVNYVGENGGERAFLQGDKPVPPYIVHPITAGGQTIRLGILGVVLPFTQMPYLSYKDVNESFRQTLAELKPVSDLQLAITHNNLDEDIELAEKVPGVPLFLGGHEHANLSRYVGSTIITKADANAKTVYIHRVRFDPATGMTNVRSELKTIDDTIAEESKTKAVVDKWLGQVYGLMTDMGYDAEHVVMEMDEPLVCKEHLIRTSQTNYGQLTMASIARAFPGADLYALNSGSMRLDDNLFNTVTEYDVLRTFPYGGEFVTLEMPGDVVSKLLQTGMKTNYGEGGYLQLLGNNADGTSLNGAAIVPTQTYKVVMPAFMAAGNEANLGFLKDYLKDEPVATVKIEGKTVKNDLRDLVIDYMLTL
ncbi:bifunctional metallophosphatase/5'-nucleotidase [Neolewinella aurantiaca]|uniref:Bifunctional metallophosphatase/5'-nucleotidase n=1 Tax=Neolewinella aurantiaca TaxID=2602767 RepID=A0A5C7FD26_9BACT|nr:bifunctional metallophosphatase/5'-nucleotidase [Neolewinella aurantiaca]TXF88878.1 bifunctional metallophosphatase/5'-nucleotidase [Neolewinella aurantiaca]